MLRYKITKFLSFFLFYINFCVSVDIKQNPDFKLGIENISQELLQKLLTKKNEKLPAIALITNQTGIDQKGNRNIDILLSKGLNLKMIFAPEHGIDGKTAAEKTVHDVKDEKTGLPIMSLYLGDSRFRKFDKEFDDIDIFIFDIQDSGMRHYTYISILFKIIQICADLNKKLIVLDRPNPLGYLMEGPLVHPHLFSFVSIAPIPLRHAMTIGELARYFNKYLLKKPATLTVVKMNEYNRTNGLNGKLPIHLSPNIKNINACLNYSFLGILGEITPFTALTGTEDAFECLMVPNTKNYSKIKWDDVKKLLDKYQIDSSLYKYIKLDGKNFKGLKIKIKDINKFSNFKTIIAILDFFKKIGIKFYYSKIFNKVLGTYQFRHFIDGKISKEKFFNHINNELKEFYDKAKEIFIYYPFPKIIELK